MLYNSMVETRFIQSANPCIMPPTYVSLVFPYTTNADFRLRCLNKTAPEVFITLSRKLITKRIRESMDAT